MIIPFEPEHAQAIVADNLRKQDDCFTDAEQFLKLYDAARNGGPAYTLMVDDVPVACAGVVLQGWRKGEAWSLLSSLFHCHKIKVFRALKSGLDSVIFDHQLRRVQSVVNPEYPQTIDFIECLGFEYEGRLKRYGPFGEDYLMFSRTI